MSGGGGGRRSGLSDSSTLGGRPSPSIARFTIHFFIGYLPPLPLFGPLIFKFYPLLFPSTAQHRLVVSIHPFSLMNS